jgi:hypothetical protein
MSESKVGSMIATKLQPAIATFPDWVLFFTFLQFRDRSFYHSAHGFRCDEWDKSACYKAVLINAVWTKYLYQPLLNIPFSGLY